MGFEPTGLAPKAGAGSQERRSAGRGHRRLLERNARASDFDILAALAATAPLHPRDVVHVFKAAVLAATGAELGDDAAVLCLDWRGSTRQGAL